MINQFDTLLSLNSNFSPFGVFSFEVSSLFDIIQHLKKKKTISIAIFNNNPRIRRVHGRIGTIMLGKHIGNLKQGDAMEDGSHPYAQAIVKIPIMSVRFSQNQPQFWHFEYIYRRTNSPYRLGESLPPTHLISIHF